MNIDIKVHGLDELKKNFANCPDIFNTVMKSALTESGKAIQKTAINKSPSDTGALKGNISLRSKLYSAEVIANKHYAIYVEKGTKPHFPPVSALEGWALRHGTTAIAVARSIARKGTKAQPFMQPAVDQNLGYINSIFSKAGTYLVKQLAR